jgi:ferredoxin-NADP reductase
VRVAEADKPAFIAVASPVGASATTLELLVKGAPGTAEALCGLAAGASLQVTDVQGKGFVLPEQLSDVLVFATGSGLSPIRALMDTPPAQGGLAGCKSVTVFYGARTPKHVPFTQQLAAWQRAGVRVTTVFSQQTDGSKAPSYVQDVFAQAGVPVSAATTAVLVGQKPLSEAVIASLTAAGVPRERIIMNF